jgi:hypothetical protein
MRLLLVNFAGLTAMAFLQIHGRAGEDVLKEKIIRQTLNHNEPAVVKVGTNGVTSLEFPYRIEAIDGFGFSQTPGSGDAFQISYTKGTNYFSVRALKPGATGNLTVVLDQKVYAFFFEESSNPTFVNIFGPGNEGGSAPAGEREIAEKSKVATEAGQARQNDPEPDKDFDLAINESTDAKTEGLTFSQPPGNYLPTAATLGQAGQDPELHLGEGPGTNPEPQPAATPAKHQSSKRAARKSDPKPDLNAKESIARTQKPLVKKLFGWL